MRCALVVAAFAAVVRAQNNNFLMTLSYTGATCTGPFAMTETFRGCAPGGPGLWQQVACTNPGAGVYNLFMDASCAIPANPASVAIPITLGTCVPGMGDFDATLTTCAQGPFVPPTTGLTATYYSDATCTGDVTAIANYPMSQCTLGPGRAAASHEAPYIMAQCFNTTHISVTSVRPRGWHLLVLPCALSPLHTHTSP